LGVFGFFLFENSFSKVEHPITEMITGVDIVEQMIRIAAGERLQLEQKDIVPKGWAVESRV
jgi:propionyl-CoA carboxylase alpha chain